MVGRGGKFCTGGKIISFLSSPLDFLDFGQKKNRKIRKQEKRKEKKKQHENGQSVILQRPPGQLGAHRLQSEIPDFFWNFFSFSSPATACHVVADHDCASRGPSTA